MKKVIVAMSLMLVMLCIPSVTHSAKEAEMRTYYFLVKTENVSKAGTDSGIYVIVHGLEGKTKEIRLNDYISGNALERGDLECFEVDLKDVGKINILELRSDCKYAGSGWKPLFVQVDTARFTINKWITDTSSKIYDRDPN